MPCPCKNENIAYTTIFWYLLIMQVKINNRGNGACPLCHYDKKCSFQKKLTKALETVKSKEEFELVVYTCPYFKEKF